MRMLLNTGPYGTQGGPPPQSRRREMFTGPQADFLLFTTFVMACRIVMPARSTSFLDSPLVTHTLSAGWICDSHPTSFLLIAWGTLFNREMSTPLANVWTRDCISMSSGLRTRGANVLHRPHLAVAAPDLAGSISC